MISSNGSFNQTQIAVAEQANKVTFALHKRLNDFRNINPHEMMTLFNRYISPILNYGCEVWGFHKAPNIERVHLNFCKRILQVKRTTQNDFIYGELGRHPMCVCRQIKIIRYWLNIVSGKKAPYVCALLLFQCGFGEAWYNQGVGDTEIFMNLFKQRVYDIYKQSWESRLRDSSRATFYRAIKDMYVKSNYMRFPTFGIRARAALSCVRGKNAGGYGCYWGAVQAGPHTQSGMCIGSY